LPVTVDWLMRMVAFIADSPVFPFATMERMTMTLAVPPPPIDAAPMPSLPELAITLSARVTLKAPVLAALPG
jgi:hypothetical protein